MKTIKGKQQIDELRVIVNGKTISLAQLILAADSHLMAEVGTGANETLQQLANDNKQLRALLLECLEELEDALENGTSEKPAWLDGLINRIKQATE